MRGEVVGPADRALPQPDFPAPSRPGWCPQVSQTPLTVARCSSGIGPERACPQHLAAWPRGQRGSRGGLGAPEQKGP